MMIAFGVDGEPIRLDATIGDFAKENIQIQHGTRTNHNPGAFDSPACRMEAIDV